MKLGPCLTLLDTWMQGQGGIIILPKDVKYETNSAAGDWSPSFHLIIKLIHLNAQQKCWPVGHGGSFPKRGSYQLIAYTEHVQGNCEFCGIQDSWFASFVLSRNPWTSAMGTAWSSREMATLHYFETKKTTWNVYQRAPLIIFPCTQFVLYFGGLCY